MAHLCRRLAVRVRLQPQHKRTPVPVLGLGKRRWSTAASCVGAWAHKARRSGMQACRRRRMKRSERAQLRHWAAASQLPAHWVGPKTLFGP